MVPGEEGVSIDDVIAMIDAELFRWEERERELQGTQDVVAEAYAMGAQRGLREVWMALQTATLLELWEVIDGEPKERK